MSDRAASISVAMCTFNGGRFVGEQLRSIAAQSLRPEELIVCDDGSSDETLAVVEAFARAAPFDVRLQVGHERLGPARNFEKAIALCTGDIIAPADQDDVWHTDKLLVQERVLRKGTFDAVFGDADVVGPGLEPLGYRMWDAVGFSRRERAIVKQGQAIRVFLRRDVVTGASLLFRSRWRETALPIPDGWVHDAWIALVVAAFGRIGYVDRPLIRYRQHAANHIGAPPRPGLAGAIKRAVGPVERLQRDALEAQLKRVASASSHLSEIEDPQANAVLEAIAEKEAHIRHRLLLPDSKLRRVPVVLRELASGRYHRFSAGPRSAGKDLLVRR